MRKFLFTLFILTFLCCPSTSLARTVVIDELYLRLELPNDYIFITRETTDANTIKKFGFASKQEALAAMQKENEYLLAIDSKFVSIIRLEGFKTEFSQEVFDYKNIKKDLEEKGAKERYANTWAAMLN